MNALGNSTSPMFYGKTHNRHPHWKDVPLRLAPAQTDDPKLVIEDFFECFNLCEIRQILWEWTIEIIASNSSLSNEGLKRANHIYFYEKIEMLVEATFILNNRTEESTVDIQSNDKNILHNNGDITTSENTMKEIGLPFKNYFPQEKATTDPKSVISKICHEESYEILSENLLIWFYMAMATENSVYEEGKQREQLILFYERLKSLLEAIYKVFSDDAEQHDEQLKRTRNLDERVIVDFFKDFKMNYIISEMDDLLVAGISYEGRITEWITKSEVMDCFRTLISLIKTVNVWVEMYGKAFVKD